MDPVGVAAVLSLAGQIKDAGMVVGAILILVAGARGWWVYEREHKAALAREAEWKRMYFEQNDLLKTLTRHIDPDPRLIDRDRRESSR